MEQSDILDLAERLGKAIAAAPQAKKLQEARAALREEPGTDELLNQFRQQSEKIARLQGENKPIEVDDKHKLEELHNKLVASEAFKKLTAAQVDYVDLMRKVNTRMQQQMGPPPAAPPATPAQPAGEA